MSKRHEAISAEMQSWLMLQPVFFVATAPLNENGNVNCSPKGGNTFRILGEREVAYVDLTGSGIETIAHLQENGRIVLMFCAFTGPPKIVRLHGKGEVIYPADAGYAKLSPFFSLHPGARAIIRVSVNRVSDSCGFGVPRLDFVANRDALDQWAEKKGPAGLQAYRSEKNLSSIDGLPGYKNT
jgi:hypothetical protein